MKKTAPPTAARAVRRKRGALADGSSLPVVELPASDATIPPDNPAERLSRGLPAWYPPLYPWARAHGFAPTQRVPRLVFETPVTRSRGVLRAGHQGGVHTAWAKELSFFLFAAWTARGELAAPLKGDEARETRADVRRWIRLMLPFVRRTWAAICLGNEALARAELRNVERAWTAASSGPLLSMALKHFDNFEKSKHGGRKRHRLDKTSYARRRSVIQGLAAGRPVVEVAADAKVTEERVRQIRRKAEEEALQRSSDLDAYAKELGVPLFDLQRLLRAAAFRRSKSEA